VSDKRDQSAAGEPSSNDRNNETARQDTGSSGRDVEATSAMASAPTTSTTNEILRNWKPIDTTALSQAIGAMATLPTTKLIDTTALSQAIGAMATTGRFMRSSRFADSYIEATTTLLASLDIGDLDLDGLDVGPTRDSAAYEAIAAASPETAAAIDAAAEHVRLPFWSRVVVRNTLAWLLASIIVSAYVAGTLLFPPWGALVVAILSAGGVTGPSAYKAVAADRAAPDQPSGSSETPRGESGRR